MGAETPPAQLSRLPLWSAVTFQFPQATKSICTHQNKLFFQEQMLVFLL